MFESSWAVLDTLQQMREQERRWWEAMEEAMREKQAKEDADWLATRDDIADIQRAYWE